MLASASASAAGQAGASGDPATPGDAATATGRSAPTEAAQQELLSGQRRESLVLGAVRLETPLQLDGRLDEAFYASVGPVAGFVQNEPFPGEPATERTEVWVSFDDNLYVSVRAWESEPERMVVNEMRRDSANLLQNENFAFMLYTFNDGRNSVVFQFNPAGGRMDGQVTTESQVNNDWNPVWELSTALFDGGWTAEAAVPYRSLRCRPGSEQTWGFNATHATYTATPRMFLSGLVQYNSSSRSVASNVQFRWEYQSGSELFVVYNETRDTERPGGFPGVQDRALIVKINRLFRL